MEISLHTKNLTIIIQLKRNRLSKHDKKHKSFEPNKDYNLFSSIGNAHILIKKFTVSFKNV